MNKLGIQISISADQLATNFEKGYQEFSPSLLRQGPNEWSEEICKSEVSYLSKPIDTLKAICKMIAAEYFHHPIIRTYIKNICFEKLYITTTPTKKGIEAVDVYNYYYPTKRITGKKILHLKPELWMLALESEKKGFITIEFVMGHDRDKNWNELKKKIEKLINFNREVKGTNEKKLVENWNIIRSRICENLIKYYAKPTFEKEFKKFLTDKGKKIIIRNAKAEFKAMINNKPYKPKVTSSLDDNEVVDNTNLHMDRKDPSNLLIYRIVE